MTATPVLAIVRGSRPPQHGRYLIWYVQLDDIVWPPGIGDYNEHGWVGHGPHIEVTHYAGPLVDQKRMAEVVA